MNYNEYVTWCDGLHKEYCAGRIDKDTHARQIKWGREQYEKAAYGQYAQGNLFCDGTTTVGVITPWPYKMPPGVDMGYDKNGEDTHKPLPTAYCQHEWKVYDSGFTRYEYCAKCDIKRDNK